MDSIAPCPTLGLLPAGVLLRSLAMHQDHRGTFTEIFRQEWDTGITPIQWNCVSSQAGTLRGVHVHVHHDDYLVVLSGRGIVGLRDLRRRSPTEGRVAMLPLEGGDHQGITIPHGVAHGFFFPEPSIHIYSVSRYWDIDDELGCRWDDPDLGLDWPIRGAPLLSERDASAPSLATLLSQLES